MVTTYFSPADILYSCREVYEEGGEPIIYVSKRNAEKLMKEAFNKFPDTNLTNMRDEKYIGNYKGTPVYVTQTVGDLFVIVPRLKEN